MTDKELRMGQEGRNPSLKETQTPKRISGFHTDGRNPPLAQVKISRPTILPPAPPIPPRGKK
jgi:hypothetical protein